MEKKNEKDIPNVKTWFIGQQRNLGPTPAFFFCLTRFASIGLVGRILTSFIHKCSNLPLLNHRSQSPSHFLSADSHTYGWQNVVFHAGCLVGTTISFNLCAISTRAVTWFREVTYQLIPKEEQDSFNQLPMASCPRIIALTYGNIDYDLL